MVDCLENFQSRSKLEVDFLACVPWPQFQFAKANLLPWPTVVSVRTFSGRTNFLVASNNTVKVFRLALSLDEQVVFQRYVRAQLTIIIPFTLLGLLTFEAWLTHQVPSEHALSLIQTARPAVEAAQVDSFTANRKRLYHTFTLRCNCTHLILEILAPLNSNWYYGI